MKFCSWNEHAKCHEIFRLNKLNKWAREWLDENVRARVSEHWTAKFQRFTDGTMKAAVRCGLDQPSKSNRKQRRKLLKLWHLLFLTDFCFFLAVSYPYYRHFIHIWNLELFNQKLYLFKPFLNSFPPDIHNNLLILNQISSIYLHLCQTVLV